MKLLAFALPVLLLFSCFNSKKPIQTPAPEPCYGESVGIVYFRPCFFTQPRSIAYFNAPALEQAGDEIDFVVGSVVGEPQKTEHSNGGITFRGTPGDPNRYYVAVLK